MASHPCGGTIANNPTRCAHSQLAESVSKAFYKQSVTAAFFQG